MKYIMFYYEEYDRQQGKKRSKIVEASGHKTWRQLQQQEDPGYHYDDIEFYELGEKVILNE
jgi:hypothetical protein